MDWRRIEKELADAVASQGVDVRISEGDAIAYADYHCPLDASGECQGGDASGAINLSDVAKRLADVMANT